MQKLAIGFLFDDTLDSTAGVAQYVKTLGAWLSFQGHDVSYIVGETKLEKWAGSKIYSLSKNIPVSFNGNRLSIPLPISRKKITDLLSENRFDVLHVQVPYSPFMSARVIKRASSTTAVVGTFHILPAGRLARIGTRLLGLLYFRNLSRIDQMISVSSPASEFARLTLGLRSVVLPNVIDLKSFRVAPRQRNRPGTIVFLGRLVPRKGAKELLQAFQLLASWQPNAKLVVAGDGPEKASLKRFVSRAGLSAKVDFRGHIEEADKPSLLATAQIACFPALHGESFGIVLLEAMASGSGMVLGGNNPGYSSVLREIPELLVDPRDRQVLARRLQLLLNDKPLQRKIKLWQSRNIITYDINNIGPKIVATYRQAITKRLKKC